MCGGQQADNYVRKIESHSGLIGHCHGVSVVVCWVAYWEQDPSAMPVMPVPSVGGLA